MSTERKLDTGKYLNFYHAGISPTYGRLLGLRIEDREYVMVAELTEIDLQWMANYLARLGYKGAS